MGVVIVVGAIYALRRLPPLDERGRYGMLSDGAAHRWVHEDRLVGLDIDGLKKVFGERYVGEGADGTVWLGFDSDGLSNIACEMKDGRVVRAREVYP